MSTHKHRGFIPPNDIDFCDISATDIFPTTVFSCFPENVDNDKIIKECLDFSQSNPTVNRSNFGGWQSDVYCLTRHADMSLSRELENVFDLAYRAVEFCNIISEDLGSDCYFDETSPHFWININGFGDYNVLHSHPKTDLICLYYPKIEKDQGFLTILRNDSTTQNNFYSGIEDSTIFDIYPEVGKFYVFPGHLLHYVTANMTKESRISISFNMCGLN